jgi:hypothetical protein
MMHRVGIAALVLASVMFGQPDLNSITVTASRTIYVQPDQVVFEVDINSGPDASLDDIIAALAGSGITASNLSSVYVPPFALEGRAGIGPGPQLDWTFRLPAPLSKLTDTITSLTTLQKLVAQKNAGLSMTFGVQGTQTSPQQCSTPDLISDARAQAQQLANAAGVTVGPIIGVSDLSAATIPAGSIYVINAPVIFGSVGTSFALLPAVLTLPPTPPANCSLVVQFRMLR